MIYMHLLTWLGFELMYKTCGFIRTPIPTYTLKDPTEPQHLR
jgi:hypothetical protein